MAAPVGEAEHVEKLHPDVRIAGGRAVRRVLERGGLVLGCPELPSAGGDGEPDAPPDHRRRRGRSDSRGAVGLQARSVAMATVSRS